MADKRVTRTARTILGEGTYGACDTLLQRLELIAISLGSMSVSNRILKSKVNGNI